MAIIVDGKKIAATILEGLKARVKTVKKQTGTVVLAVVIVGDDQPSQTYVRKKEESARAIGVDFFKFAFKSTIGKDELISQIKKIQQEHQLSGLIIQLPLPKNLKPDTREIINQIDQQLDVDCLTDWSLDRVAKGRSKLIPPTAAAILEIFNYYQIDLLNKKILLIGRGQLVGKPLAAILTRQGRALTVCGSEIKALRPLTLVADIIICGVGKKNLITGEMVKPGVVVIDAGVSYQAEKIFGDLDFSAVSQQASLITPVPGGVGPITVAKLLENIVINSELKT